MPDDDARVIIVTPLQVEAAKVALKAGALLGQEPDLAMVKIASAKPLEQERSA